MSPHQLLWNPITGSDGCRAGDASDHAAAPPRSVMNSRRFGRYVDASRIATGSIEAGDEPLLPSSPRPARNPGTR
jgi:hypothetical protein